MRSALASLLLIVLIGIISGFRAPFCFGEKISSTNYFAPPRVDNELETAINKSYYYGAQTWAAQAGVGTPGVLYLACPWGSDADAGADSGWGNQCGANGLSCCTPPVCPTGWTSVATFAEPTSFACPQLDNECNWAKTLSYHPVAVGRTVRVCVED